ncbi:Uu.00g009720.m01.CDS01 [Anthostomella pinea]|uniref:Uu.00g009720.m01.CDS01 n=1 Tax=Anthostomella pinea TaxID=933095 RepID=A0AAI8VYN8_9PEZI|nr:Uu.00g009720.m01.CDS01 [Anthostomella pinea]
MGSLWSQFSTPNPMFTEDDVAPQDSKVFRITGGYSGIGFELAKMLYRKKGRVYIAGRSDQKGQQGIKDIQHSASAEAFKPKEAKLHVLWNNVGVCQPPVGSASKQVIELQLATNCLGPFLFIRYQLLDHAH